MTTCHKNFPQGCVNLLFLLLTNDAQRNQHSECRMQHESIDLYLAPSVYRVLLLGTEPLMMTSNIERVPWKFLG